VRARVEHQFQALKNPFRHRKARYKGLAKSAARLIRLFGLANLLIVKRRLMALGFFEKDAPA
jgi:IS5 family transposase